MNPLDMFLEEPDITCARLTGYPVNKQPKIKYCSECGVRLDDRQSFEDSNHKYLCKECLLFLHEKESWW